MNELVERLRELDPDARVRLSVVSREIGWDPADQCRAIKAGLVDPLPVPPAGRRGWQVTRDEALRIVAAAMLAAALGVAIVVVLRGARDSGLDIMRLLG